MLYPHYGIQLSNKKERIINAHRSINESKTCSTLTKSMPPVLSHAYEVLKRQNQAALGESQNKGAFWGARRGGAGGGA